MKTIIKPVLVFIFPVLLTACSIFKFPTSPPSSATSSATPLSGKTQPPTITVWFTDQANFDVGREPYEKSITRPLPAGVDPVKAVLDALLAGPTPEEAAQGLVLFSSGFSGLRSLTVENGVASIHLEGKCANNGAAYSVASLIARNLEQFPEIKAYKIYDENDETFDPDSPLSSLPYCLEP